MAATHFPGRLFANEVGIFVGVRSGLLNFEISKQIEKNVGLEYRRIRMKVCWGEPGQNGELWEPKMRVEDFGESEHNEKRRFRMFGK